MRPILLTLALAMALGHASCSADDTTTKPRDGMKIRLKLEDRVITATLIDSKTTQDFISLLRRAPGSRSFCCRSISQAEIK